MLEITIENVRMIEDTATRYYNEYERELDEDYIGASAFKMSQMSDENLIAAYSEALRICDVKIDFDFNMDSFLNWKEKFDEVLNESYQNNKPATFKPFAMQLPGVWREANNFTTNT